MHRNDHSRRSSIDRLFALHRRHGAQVAGILRGGLHAGVSACRRMMAWAGSEMLSRHHVRMLAALDDRMLADIGVARSEIPALVRSVERRRRTRNRPEPVL